MDLLKATQLEKEYRVGKVVTTVLKGVDFVLEEGEFVSIVGPSGSGKTTLMYVLSGLEPATNGTLTIFNKEIKEYTSKEKAKMRAYDVGFVFQFYNLIPHLTAYENVLLASVLGKNQPKKKIMETLAKVGMDKYAMYYPHQLSGGMQQRIAIARAIINEPKIVFADEPIGNLDYKNGLQIMELFATLNRKYNITIVMVTHNEDTIKYGSRVVHLFDGKVSKDEKSIR